MGSVERDGKDLLELALVGLGWLCLAWVEEYVKG